MEPVRAYLSPSTQETNQYVGGPTGYDDSEEYWCRRIAFEVEQYLRFAGHTVRVGGSSSARANAEDSNAWGADLHIAIHTNAGGGHGTEVFHYPGSVMGERLAVALYTRIAPVSNEPDRGVKMSSRYIELNHTKAAAVIIEYVFHDCPPEAQEIRSDWAEFAEATALGICDIAGGSIRPTLSGLYDWAFAVEDSPGGKAALVRQMRGLSNKGIQLAGHDYTAILGQHANVEETEAIIAAVRQRHPSGHVFTPALGDLVIFREHRRPPDGSIRDPWTGKELR